MAQSKKWWEEKFDNVVFLEEVLILHDSGMAVCKAIPFSEFLKWQESRSM